jgi:hypothetical protein
VLCASCKLFSISLGETHLSVTAIDVLLNAFRVSAKIMYSFAEAWGEERIKELKAILKQNRDAEAAAWRRRDEGVAKPPRFKSEVIRQLIADHPMPVKSPRVLAKLCITRARPLVLIPNHTYRPALRAAATSSGGARAR